MDEALLNDLRQVVEKNLNNEQFSVEDLAREVAYSRSQLHRKLTHLTGRSISQYIRRIRLEHAMEMLKGDVATVSEISFRVGFGSSTYFIKCFSDEYGFSPGEVKKRLSDGWFDQSPPEVAQVEQVEVSEVRPSATPLESFHPFASESLVTEVFDAVVVHKPSLQKFLMVDEDEGEKVDLRILAYQTIKSYPWPIGVELRRLFSASMKESGQTRYVQLNKTIQRILKFISIIALCELSDLLNSGSIKLSPAEKKSILGFIGSGDAKSMVGVLTVASKKIRNYKESLFVTDLNKLLDDSFFLEVKEWQKEIDEDNEVPNGQNLTEICSGLEQTLIMLLKRTAFLSSFRMVNVSSIEVRKPRYGEATFEHRFLMLNSVDSDFRIHVESADSFSDSHSVLLLKSVRESDQFLNLGPFIINTMGQELLQGAAPIKEDIYILERSDLNKLSYRGVESDSEDSLTSLTSFEDIKKSFDSVNQILTK